jgi:hypothetical protein
MRWWSLLGQVQGSGEEGSEEAACSSLPVLQVAII